MDEEELEDDLRTTSAQVSATAEQLNALETQKRKLPADHPKMVELSDEIERLAARLRRQAAIEGDLTREIRNAATGESA